MVYLHHPQMLRSKESSSSQSSTNINRTYLVPALVGGGGGGASRLILACHQEYIYFILYFKEYRGGGESALYPTITNFSYIVKNAYSFHCISKDLNTPSQLCHVLLHHKQCTQHQPLQKIYNIKL